MTAERLAVPAADGRTLEVLTLGPADGLPFVFHAGTPGGLVGHGPITEPAVGLGLRTVLYSRPGYGASTPRPGRLVADAAADVAAILDHLGAGQFVTAGWSGGGPHALACAALLPGRCLAAACVAGVAPYLAEGLDWAAGMAAENVEEFAAAKRGEAALTGYLQAQADRLANVAAAQVAESLGGLVSAADKAVLAADFAEFLAASFRAALIAGVAGWRDDDLAFVRGWGFALDAVRAVAVWQGDQDRMVPYSHGTWLSLHIPGARAHLIPGAGHLIFAAAGWDDILADLSALAGV